jgi:predicted  nucleic acid-binding Zn-ribbon protein
MAVNQDFKKSTVSTSNHTQNYDLPLWAGEDTTSWLTQMNDAMNKIDDGMVDAKSKALEVVAIAADAKKLADETKAESAATAKIVAGYNDRLTAAEEKIVEHTQDITNLNTRSDQFDVELHSVQEVQKKTTADLATLAAEVDTNKSDADAKISANTAAIAKTDENVATVTGKVTALETEVGEVSATTQSNTTAIGAINGSIEDIKSKDTAQDGQINTINTEVTSLDNRVTALEDGSKTTKTVLMYAKSDALSSVTDSNGTMQFTGCKLEAYLYSDGTCDFILSSNDTYPLATDTTFDGSVGLFDLSNGVTEIMNKFKATYPNISILRPILQHSYPVIFYNAGTLPRYVIHANIFAIFSASSTKMGITTSYVLKFSELTDTTVSLRFGFPDGEKDYGMSSKQNFMIASVFMNGV